MLRYHSKNSFNQKRSVNFALDNLKDFEVKRKDKISKFFLLLWKSIRLKLRQPIRTGIEFGTPILLALLIVLIGIQYPSIDHPDTDFKPFSVIGDEKPFQHIFSSGINIPPIILYTPNVSAVKTVMEIFNIWGRFQPIGSGNLDEDYKKQENDVFFAVEFPPDFQPTNLDTTIVIRFPAELRFPNLDLIFPEKNWKTHRGFPVYQTSEPRGFEDDTGPCPNYYKEGFLDVEFLVTFSILLARFDIEPTQANLRKDQSKLQMLEAIQRQLNREELGKILKLMGKRFPASSWLQNKKLTRLWHYVLLLMAFCYLMPCDSVARRMTYERVHPISLVLKINGIALWRQWAAWFCDLLIYLFLLTLILFLLLLHGFYEYSNFMGIMVYFSTFAISSILLSFAVVSFFYNKNAVSAVLIMIWLYSYTPYLLVYKSYDSLNVHQKHLSGVWHTSTMAHGMESIFRQEALQKGFTFKQTFILSHVFSLPERMYTLLLLGLIYVLFAIYMKTLFPGPFEKSWPFYFIFMRSYWRMIRNKEVIRPLQDQGKLFQTKVKHLKPVLHIRHLCVENQKTTIFRDLSTNAYENKINIFLSHDRAELLAIINVLIGVETPKQGIATIRGFDTFLQSSKVRRRIGLCCRENILFQDLTVYENVYFYSKLTCIRRDELKNHINEYIFKLNLQDEKNLPVKKLTLAQQRLMCIVIAFFSKSKVVILDSPTYRMNLDSINSAWELINQQSKGRTVLLFTQNVFEALELGDRIAIIRNGNLKCVGKPLFLKAKLGAGYRLVITKKEDGCDIDGLTEMLTKYIPEIEILEQTETDVTYIIMEIEQIKFEEMLGNLETNFQTFGIQGFKINLTTFEEIFERVENDEVRAKKTSKNNTVHKKYTTRRIKSEIILTVHHFLAMLLKKYYYTFGSWWIALQVILPQIFLLLSLAFFDNIYEELPLFRLQLNPHLETKTLIIASPNIRNNPSLRVLRKELLEMKSNLVFTNNITNFVLNKRKSSNSKMFRYEIGVEFEENPAEKIIMHFNPELYHSLGIVTSILLSYYFQILAPCTECDLVFYNHPLPMNTKLRMNEVMTSTFGLTFAISVSFGFTFSSSLYILFIIKERTSQFKTYQKVCRVKMWIFWTTCFVFDFCIFSLISSFFILTLGSLKIRGFSTPAELGRLRVLLFAFEYAVLPFLYWIGYYFETAYKTYFKICLIMTAYCLGLTILSLLLVEINAVYLLNVVHCVFVIVPHFALGDGLLNLWYMYYRNVICELQEKDIYHYYDSDYCNEGSTYYFILSRPGIGLNVFFCFVTGTVLFALLLLYDSDAFLTRSGDAGFGPTRDTKEDVDVLKEKRKVKYTDEKELKFFNSLVVKELTKKDGKKGRLIVNDLCFTAAQSECIGLVGHPGAGKSTALRMMAGDLRISHGNVWILGRNIKSEIESYRKSIGFCPQNVQLLGSLTVHMTIKILGLIRGVRRRHMDNMISMMAEDFELTDVLHRKVRTLSMDQRKKLGILCALVGDPPVLFFDEPTAGLDADSKRFIWNAIMDMRAKRKLIVIASSNMEECLLLCTKIGIMVNGNLKCIGTHDRLAEKFTDGYTLNLKITNNSKRPEKFIYSHFPEAKLLEKRGDLLVYYIPDTDLPCSSLFGLFERAKQRNLNIKDYTLGHTSLEQVFLNYGKYQNYY